MIERSTTSNGAGPRSLDHGLEILELFSAEGGELGVMDLSRALGLTKSTIHRLLKALTQRGYLVQDEESKKYQLSLLLYELGAAAVRQRGLHRVAITSLERLSGLIGETVHLAVLSDNAVTFIQSVESSQSVRAHSRLGHRAPAYCTAPGKVLLASSSESSIRAQLSRDMRQFTSSTIVDPDTLAQELRQVRQQGYALDLQEYQEGLTCAAAPVRDHSGRVVASVAVAAPTLRMPPERLAEIVPLLIKVSSEMSLTLGYQAGDVAHTAVAGRSPSVTKR